MTHVTEWSRRANELRSELEQSNGLGEFAGLYEGNRRVKAKIIDTRFGSCWLLHDDERELIALRGKAFLPTGQKSRVLRELGLEQRFELADAGVEHWEYARNYPFPGLYRKGDKWGQDAVPSLN